jgi:hypothetical protein
MLFKISIDHSLFFCTHSAYTYLQISQQLPPTSSSSSNTSSKIISVRGDQNLPCATGFIFNMSGARLCAVHATFFEQSTIKPSTRRWTSLNWCLVTTNFCVNKTKQFQLRPLLTIQGYSKRSIHFKKLILQILLDIWRRAIYRLKGDLSKLCSHLTSTRCDVWRGRCQIENPVLPTLHITQLGRQNYCVRTWHLAGYSNQNFERFPFHPYRGQLQ